MQISYTHKFFEATTRQYGGAQRLKQLINATGTWRGAGFTGDRGSTEEVEAEGGSEESKSSNNNGRSKGQGARNGVQNSLDAEPVRLREQSAENSWPQLFSLPVYFLKIYTSALNCSSSAPIQSCFIGGTCSSAI